MICATRWLATTCGPGSQAAEDVDALLPVLQTYLGHSSISDTAYYLRLTAASYPDITARVQRHVGDIVPAATATETGL